MKVACCYNCDIRNNGTATYAMRALKDIEGVEAFHVRSPQEEGKCPKADVYIYCDDGRDEIRWIPPRPNAFWAVDTHLGYEYRLWKAKQFDRVFVAQREAVEQFKNDGVTAEWLPLACHPPAHINKKEMIEGGEIDIDKLKREWDIAFVGFLHEGNGNGTNNRVEYLDKLFKAFPNSWLSVNVFFEEMALRFIKAKLGFNISIKDDLNMRVFEVLSTGTALLSNRNVNGLDEFFEDGVDYFGFEGKEEMVQVAKYALEHDVIRKQVADSGFKKVRASHTYKHRMKRILEVMRDA